MVRNFDEICNLMFAKMDEYSEKYGSHENWKEHIKADKQIKFIRSLNRVYQNAKDNSLKHGFVGVGCITYAEASLKFYQVRLADKLARKLA